ncbi:MAG: glycoside hydrolase family 44 protein, partial [Planctomycetaceae bacterium]
RLLAAVSFSIDPQQDSRPISKFVYGVNQSLDGNYANATFTRLGGNRWTAYNWENNASNAGSDWYFQNDAYLGGGDTPGGAVIPILQNAASRNAGALVTIPVNGYVAADKNGGGDVRNSGTNYLQTRFRQEVPAKGTPFSLTPDTT